MKNTLFILLFLLLIPLESLSQIDIMESPKKKEKPQPPIVQYDSLLNFDSRIDERSYVGQKVYCVKDYWTPMNGEHPHEYNLYGKYLTIVENTNPTYNGNICLMDEDSVVYKFGGCGRYCAFEGRNSYFVIVGYVEKMKELYEGQDFIYVKGEESVHTWPFNGVFDRKTHTTKINIKKGSKWHCDGVGVSLDNRFSVARSGTLCNRVVLYLSNEKHDSIYCYTFTDAMESNVKYRGVKDGNDSGYILNKFMTPQAYAKQQKANAATAEAKKEANEKAVSERWQKLVNAYGEKNANMILRGEVAIGFTKSMCREAWGSPKSVNTTETALGVNEQWVYGGNRYLYFDNGILTTIQR